ncbi:MAG TPA: heme ABC transporter ATP-binding protein, partial [Chloroflexi bacterium]|nr:heme ABC transporter ATP-binding protein [Chloroflexota bacterium]
MSPNIDTENGIGLDMRLITKRFPGVLAADQVNFSVRKGEVHGLLGENGAGKTTLMSILCGLYMPDDGEIFLGTERNAVKKVNIGSPREAIQLGIGMVHQHFRLVQSHTVAENCILGLSDKSIIINHTEIANRIAAIGERYQMYIEPDSYVWQLSIGEQQRVEILKMLYRNADVLILDEPTAVLTPQESQALGITLRTMAKEGKAVVFISHKLDEIMEITDRVTVLRNGCNVKTVETA